MRVVVVVVAIAFWQVKICMDKSRSSAMAAMSSLLTDNYNSNDDDTRARAQMSL